MNIKFRMPKFQLMTDKKGIAKELLMTIIATTISIILTFGTAMLLDKKQQKNDGRQMAMMVIHDMDQNIALFVKFSQEEDWQTQVVHYVMNNPDQLESMSDDTLSVFVNYITLGLPSFYDDSKEKIFNSSQDTWKSIDNPQFIDMVQDFYRSRRGVYATFAENRTFIPPIGDEEIYKVALQAPGFSPAYDTNAMKALINDNRVIYYVMLSPSRKNYLESTASEWKRVSDQCKFIMGITDEELEEYIKKQNQTGSAVKDSEIRGSWKGTSLLGRSSEQLSFNKDHTFTLDATREIIHPLFSGRLLYTMHFSGTWQIEGDSLIRHYNPNTMSVEFDTSEFTYPEAMKDSAEHYVAEYVEFMDGFVKEQKVALDTRRSQKISIDKSGNKIEIITKNVNEEGQEVETAIYLSRVKK